MVWAAIIGLQTSIPAVEFVRHALLGASERDCLELLSGSPYEITYAQLTGLIRAKLNMTSMLQSSRYLITVFDHVRFRTPLYQFCYENTLFEPPFAQSAYI